MNSTTATLRRKAAAKRPANRELGLVPIREIRPCPENDTLYRPVDPADPDFQHLVDSVRENGILEPLVVTSDGWIISGHRRFAAAVAAGLAEVPVRRLRVPRAGNTDRFIELLREHNRQRLKTADERLREALVDVDPADAYQVLLDHRQDAARVESKPLRIRGIKQRAEITAAKRPFLRSIKQIVHSQRAFWPLSDRQIHYGLLNDPPLKHASKPASRYENDPPSYKALTELLTRARLAGEIPFAAIADATRPVVRAACHKEAGEFIGRELDRFLKGYQRDLQQSQPNHLELVVEKNTVLNIVQPVALDYCIPVTSGRGYCSLPPRYEMAQRFERSGKEKLVLLVASDFDPDGLEIAHSLARSMRDDFGIASVHPVRIALTPEQVAELGLVPSMEAKTSSAQYAKFASRHGTDVFELEAIQPPDRLQRIVRQAIEAHLDMGLFNAEADCERQDAVYLEGLRREVKQSLRGLRLGKGGEA